MSLAIVAEVLKAPLIGADAKFTGVTTDTRALKAGELFVALAGPRHDGHLFLADALGRGAAGALLSRPMTTPLPYVQVADTRVALGELASFWRGQFAIPIIAVTGSNGKTTVKEMIGAIMAEIVTIEDRREAIVHAIDLASAGDVVLVAGKGHEKYQEAGGRVMPFDDVAVAREALEARREKSRVG